METVGRTIEEMDACFEFPFPPKPSWKCPKLVKDENDELAIKVADLEGLKPKEKRDGWMGLSTGALDSRDRIASHRL